MSNLPNYNYMLSEDREDNILEKIKNIQKCSDWCNFDLNVTTSDINLASLSYQDSRNGEQIYQNLSKLSLDYWLDYDFYKSFTFESKFQHKDYIKGLEQLGFECNDGHWQSIRKPDVKTVVANIFAHCLYAQISYEMIPDECSCSYCGLKVECVLRKCSCGASMEDIEEYRNLLKKNRDKSQEKEEEQIQTNQSILLDSGIYDLNLNDETVSEADSIKDIKEFRKSTLNMNEESNKKADKEMSYDRGNIIFVTNGTKDQSVPAKGAEMKPAPDKWMCGGCGAGNEYSFVNCVVCGGLPLSGKWYCGQCNCVNNRDDKCCSKCQKENNIETTLGSRKDDRMCSKCGSLKNDGSEECRKCLQRTTIIVPPLNDDQWECSKCALRHTYDAIKCGTCKLDRHLYGKWACTECTFINPLSVTICETCNSNNQYLRVETLRRDNGGDVDVIGAEGKDGLWLCCEQTISQDTEYCPKCQLWRHNPQERGHECKRLHKDKVKLVWLCHACRTVNSMKGSTCTKKHCGETRYPKVQCPNCQTISKGKIESCKKCHERLI